MRTLLEEMGEIFDDEISMKRARGADGVMYVVRLFQGGLIGHAQARTLESALILAAVNLSSQTEDPVIKARCEQAIELYAKPPESLRSPS